MGYALPLSTNNNPLTKPQKTATENNSQRLKYAAQRPSLLLTLIHPHIVDRASIQLLAK